MKIFSLRNIIASGFLFIAPLLHATEGTGWAGEYADKSFLGGSAVFQLTIEQQANKIQISFDAANNDGSGCTPEAQGMAKTAGKDRLEFSFKDNQGNSGTGSAVRKGSELIVSLKASHLAKSDCARFYRENIRLKRLSN